MQLMDDTLLEYDSQVFTLAEWSQRLATEMRMSFSAARANITTATLAGRIYRIVT